MDAPHVARALEAWFATHARDLPWRRDHDPYHVLVSEFILQQTRMETGLRYYGRFLERFPTLRSLAQASEPAVLRVWSGLGYYSRARRLRATARLIVKEFGGSVPRDAAVLESLPGIGPYTAGAIASIAYDQAVPALDGNQVRVLGRFWAEHDPKNLRNRAVALLRNGAPRRINQALMDLGSQVCRPSNPFCGECPLRSGCSYRRGDQRPRSSNRGVPVVEGWRADAHVRRDHVRLVQRRQGLLKGLWLPPLARIRSPGRPPDLVHRFSHRTWRIYVVAGTGRPPPGGRWVSLEDLGRLPHSALTRAFARRVLAPSRKRRPRSSRSGAVGS